MDTREAQMNQLTALRDIAIKMEGLLIANAHDSVSGNLYNGLSNLKSEIQKDAHELANKIQSKDLEIYLNEED